jgi:RNA polymerase sigma-70 factor, ECF subfamily
MAILSPSAQEPAQQLALQLEGLRPGLVRFAILQLRNEMLAEDVVQDTLLAVLEKPDRFAGHSSLRTYVTGILKYKIIDVLRAGNREYRLESNEEESDADVIDALFAPDGHAIEVPRQWGDPDATLQEKDFFRIMQLCLERLPARNARVFMMREWLELDTAEICKELGISSSNLWVILYRARVQLRECLDINWFGNRPP